MRPSITRVMFLTGSAAMVIFLATGCRSGERIITLTQTKQVTLKSLDTNPNGIIGDVTLFDAPVEKDGKPYGSVMGTMTKVGDLGAGSRPDLEERMLTAVFALPSGQISVLGVSFYKKNAIFLPSGEPMTRAIVGGTGDYVGIDGEVTTTHNSDGSYTHVLKIMR